MSNDFSLSTQFEINEIEIDDLDVIGLFQSISIFENISSAVITGSIVMLDSDGASFIEKNKIEGNEKITFKFTNANKEIYDDLQNYIGSRIPGVNLTVPDKIDWWTGQPVNEIDNPILRILNAVNPIPVTQTMEPWRVWINQSGLDLSTMILKDSSGTHTYTAQERSILSKFIGDQQIWKVIYGNGKPDGGGLMFNQKYNDQLDIVRAELATGKTFDELQPDTRKLPVVRRLTALVKQAQRDAEQKMFAMYPTIEQKVIGKELADKAMKQGDPSKAYSIAEKTQQQLKELENFR